MSNCRIRVAGTKVFKARENVVSCDIDGGQALLDLDKGQYYGLNSTASEVWKCISESMSFEAIIDHICSEFEVDRQRCADDVSSIIESFVNAGIVLS